MNDISQTAGGLIFDRTQADADHALSLEREGIYTGENLRGAYNSSDRNRVGAALNYLLGALRHNGYEHMGHVKSDWHLTDIVRERDNAEVIAQLGEARRVLPQISHEIPYNLDYLDLRKANAVERILFDMFENYDRLLDTWLWCGEGYAGDAFEEHKFDDWWE